MESNYVSATHESHDGTLENRYVRLNFMTSVSVYAGLQGSYTGLLYDIQSTIVMAMVLPTIS